MRAIRFHALGEPDVLRLETDVPEPSAPPGGAVVRVRAAGVNFADTRFRRGTYFIRPRFPQIPGMELAGDVVALGPGTVGLAVGDRVMGTALGTYAELAAARAEDLFPIPAKLDYARAAALPVQGLTAHHLLGLAGRLAPGERVLVHAAAGGVGSLAVQLARRKGAGQIIATASSTAKLDLALAHGAQVGIDYTREDWVARIKDVTGGAGVDLILDMLGGQDALDKNLKCLAPFGRLVVYGAASGDTKAKLEPIGLMAKNQSVIGYYLTPLFKQRELLAGPLAELAELAASGELDLQVSERLPLEQAADAHARMEARQTTGKVVLEP
jgi:NADPH2:quinone reductase